MLVLKLDKTVKQKSYTKLKKLVIFLQKCANVNYIDKSFTQKLHFGFM